MNRFFVVVIFLFWLTSCSTACRRNESNPAASYRADTGDRSPVTANGSNAEDANSNDVDGGPNKTAMRLTSEAITKMRNGDTDAALLSVQQAVALDEDYIDARWHLLNMLHRRGIDRLQNNYTEEGYDDLVEMNHHALWMNDHLDRLDDKQRELLASANYNCACAFAQRGFTSKAIAALTRAFALGFDDYQQLKNDTDLEPLRELDEFKTLLKKHQEEDIPDPDSTQPESNPEPNDEVLPTWPN